MLTIATVTNFQRPEALQRTIKSVEVALVPGVTHKIFDGSKDFINAHFSARKCDEYVAIVDDDDTIMPNAISIILAAISALPGYGVYCSDEMRVDVAGCSLIDNAKILRTYAGVMSSPRNVHHLCVTNSRYIDTAAFDIHDEFGFGGCWILKVGAAITGGMVHIPQKLYNWTDTPNSLSKIDADKYHSKLPLVTKRLKQVWGTRTDSIPKFIKE